MKPLTELVLSLALAAQAPLPSPMDPAQYAARDSHEGATLAARPYREPAELEARFGRHPLAQAGTVVVEVLVVNEREEAIRVAWERVVLLSGTESLEQVEPEQIAWRVYPPPKTKSKQPWPGPPTKLPADKKRLPREALEAALVSQGMRVEVIAAGGRARGFLYFYLGDQPLDLARARLYVPEVVRLPEEEPLLFFELDLKVYAKP